MATGPPDRRGGSFGKGSQIWGRRPRSPRAPYGGPRSEKKMSISRGQSQPLNRRLANHPASLKPSRTLLQTWQRNYLHCALTISCRTPPQSCVRAVDSMVSQHATPQAAPRRNRAPSRPQSGGRRRIPRPQKLQVAGKPAALDAPREQSLVVVYCSTICHLLLSYERPIAPLSRKGR